MILIKDKLIDSKESLIELNNLLDNLAICGAPAGTDKNNFMTEVTNLKMEARKLLDEINQYFERSPNGIRIYNSPYDWENISFKERLKNLRQKIHTVSAQNIRIK